MTENNLTPLTSHEESIVKLFAGHEEILRLVEQAFSGQDLCKGISLLIKETTRNLSKGLENLLTV